MAHQRLLVERVLVTAWRTPEPADVSDIVADLAANRQRLGRQLLYLSVIGPTSLPQGQVRDELVGFYTALLTHCESMHIVIEGTEFQQSIKRSVIANVLLVVPSRGRVFIENSLPGVIQASPATLRPELARASQAAIEAKLFDFARLSVPPQG